MEVQLLSYGEILKKHSSNNTFATTSLIQTIRNSPVRGHIWSISSVSHHIKRAEFLLCDERGQIFHFNLLKNQYNVVKNASSIINSCTFIHSTPNLLAIAYQNGEFIIYDLLRKHITKQLVDKNSHSTIRLVRCHPSSSTLLSVSTNNTVTIWDVMEMKQVEALNCNESVVDVNYECNGSLIALVLEGSGIYYYRSSDLMLVSECPFPSSERKPNKWVAYSSYVTNQLGEIASNRTSIVNIRSYVSGCDGKIYVWNSLGVKLKDVCDADTNTYMVGVIELPVDISSTIGIKVLLNVDSITRVCVMSDKCDLHIIDVCDAGLSTVGSWIVVSTINDKNNIIGSSSSSDCAKTSKGNGKSNILEASSKHIIVVHSDGCARMYDINLLPTSYSGTVLYARSPYPVRNISEEVIMQSKTRKVKEKVPVAYKRVNGDSIDVDSSSSSSSSSLLVAGASKSTLKQPAIASSTATSTIIMNGWTGHSHFTDIDTSDNRKPTTSKIVSNKAHTSIYLSNDISSTDPNGLNGTKFELTGLSPRDAAINEHKLIDFYKAHRRFPDKYRELIYRFLLKLPENEVSFHQLKEMGIHHSVHKLQIQYPMRENSHILDKLLTICSVIVHWAPPFAQSSYLPQLVFPFIVLFPDSELIVITEIAMTLIMMYGYSWHISYPNEPHHIIDGINNLLVYHDSNLHHHFDKFDVNAGVVGWRLISTMFTEFLSKSNWVILMDFFISHISSPGYILLVVIALLRSVKVSLYQATNAKYLTTYFTSEQGVAIYDVIDNIEYMIKKTPSKYLLLSSTSSDASSVANASSSLSNDNGDDELNRSKNTSSSAVASSPSGPIFPLRSGRYPEYDNYPKFLLEWQSKHTEAETLLQNELHKKEMSLKELENKINEINSNHENWMYKYQASIASEKLQEEKKIKKEKEMMQRMQLMEEKISKQQILALTKIDLISQEEMRLMSQFDDSSRELLIAREKLYQDQIAFNTNVHKHRLISSTAEAEAQDRLLKLSGRRQRNDSIRNISSIIDVRQTEIDAKSSERANRWYNDDEATRIAWMDKLDSIKGLTESIGRDRLKHELESKLNHVVNAQEADLIQMSYDRRVRMMKDKAIISEEDKLYDQLTADPAVFRDDIVLLLNERESSLVHAHNAVLALVEEVKQSAKAIIANEEQYQDMQQIERSRSLKLQLKQTWQTKLHSHIEAIITATTCLQEQLVSLKFIAMKEDIVQSRINTTSSKTDRELECMIDSVSSSNVILQEHVATVNELGNEIIQRQKARFRAMQEALAVLSIDEELNIPTTATTGVAASTTTAAASTTTTITDDDEDEDGNYAIGTRQQYINISTIPYSHTDHDGDEVDSTDNVGVIGISSSDDSDSSIDVSGINKLISRNLPTAIAFTTVHTMDASADDSIDDDSVVDYGDE